jgi:hypothetical protein
MMSPPRRDVHVAAHRSLCACKRLRKAASTSREGAVRIIHDETPCEVAGFSRTAGGRERFDAQQARFCLQASATKGVVMAIEHDEGFSAVAGAQRRARAFEDLELLGKAGSRWLRGKEYRLPARRRCGRDAGADRSGRGRFPDRG